MNGIYEPGEEDSSLFFPASLIPFIHVIITNVNANHDAGRDHHQPNRAGGVARYSTRRGGRPAAD
jgi:hypothetical protein